MNTPEATAKLNTALWKRIEAFVIDDDPTATRPFLQRLAQEQNWSIEFAKRVVYEYRRFMYLAVAAGHPVTPSVAVDHAWHLHLTYSRSYWQRFCPEALGKPIHHEPTTGGDDEESKFQDWYAKTRASYLEHFGTMAPPDIWPGPTTDQALGGNARHVRRRLSGRRMHGGLMTLMLIGVVIFTIVLACMVANQSGNSIGGVATVCALGALVFIIMLIAWTRQATGDATNRRDGATAGGGGCSTAGCGSLGDSPGHAGGHCGHGGGHCGGGGGSDGGGGGASGCGGGGCGGGGD